MKIPSKLIEEAVEALAGLPGVGRKTALRLALHLVQQDSEVARKLGQSIVKMRDNIRFCQKCHNLSDGEICQICSNPARDQSVVCVVEGIRDVMAIEDTGQFRGAYHVLGGVISPIEGIGPDALHIESLIDRIRKTGVQEIIMAISPTIEGDTTIFYIARQLKDLEVRISTIARGVSFGGELQYADEVTLARSIHSRTPYQA